MDFVNSNFFKVFSKKIDYFLKNSKKFVNNYLFWKYLRNPFFKSLIGLKWALKNSIYFMFNGFFIYLAFDVVQSANNPITKMFAYGSSFMFLIWTIRKLFNDWCEYKYKLNRIPLQKASSEWEKYKKIEYKKRGME